jgi:hypothetical protein
MSRDYEEDSDDAATDDEEFDYDEIDDDPDDTAVTAITRGNYRVNAKKFAFIRCAEFIPAARVSQDVDIGDIIHIISRQHGYCYVQCIVDYLDAEYASIHRIDMTGYAERTYKFRHGQFLVFKMPAEYWRAALSQSWKPALTQTSIDTKESQNELEVNE